MAFGHLGRLDPGFGVRRGLGPGGGGRGGLGGEHKGGIRLFASLTNGEPPQRTETMPEAPQRPTTGIARSFGSGLALL